MIFTLFVNHDQDGVFLLNWGVIELETRVEDFHGV